MHMSRLHVDRSDANVAPQVEEGGLRTGPITSFLLRNSYTKTLTRTYLLVNVSGPSLVTDPGTYPWLDYC